MYNMLSFVREKYPNESKTWNFQTHSVVTPENFVSFGHEGETLKVLSTAEVSWRSDLEHLSARYAVFATLHGITFGDQKIPTPDFDVINFNTSFDGRKVSRSDIVLGRIIEFCGKEEIIPVPFHLDSDLTKAIFSRHADIFMREKISQIEGADATERLKLEFVE